MMVQEPLEETSEYFPERIGKAGCWSFSWVRRSSCAILCPSNFTVVVFRLIRRELVGGHVRV